MSSEPRDKRLAEFIHTHPAFVDALKLLKPGREIQIRLQDQQVYSLFFHEGELVFENKPAQNPDIEFQINHQALDHIISQKAPSMAALGILIVQQIQAETIHVRLISGVFAVLTGGYLRVIQKAGPEFLSYLGKYGLKGLSGIRKFIQSMK